MARSTDSTSPTIFISYSRANSDRVQTVARRLRGWGYAVWLDQFDLEAGADWRSAIQKAIKQADFLVLAHSRSSVKSDMVEWELELAQQAGTRIIPIDFGARKSDTVVSGHLEKLHHISFKKGNDRGMAALVEALGGIRNDEPYLPGDFNFPEIGENTRAIAELVRFLQEFSFCGGVVELKGGEDWQYYIEFHVMTSISEVNGWAVGNANLKANDVLDENQLTKLETLGWVQPTAKSHGDFEKVWFVNSARSRALMAGEIMRTFLDVYGHLKGEQLELHVQLNH